MLVFVIDDSISAISFMKRIIVKEANLRVRSFLNPRDALDALAKKQEAPDLIIVDYMMPEMNGVEVIQQLSKTLDIAEIPIIMATSETDTAIKMAAMEAGATEFLNKPLNTAELIVRIRNLMGLRRAQKELAKRAAELENDIASARVKLENQEKEIIWRLSKAMARRHGETAEHLDRVAVVAKLIADELGLDAQTSQAIYAASPLHDVGKIGVADSILLKPGKLTAEEFAEMRQHAAWGEEILKDSSSDLIQTAARIAKSHHEKWDGSGYPMGLSGDEIPLEARIVAIADVFDALCSERPYKAAWPLPTAFQEILRCSGSHFDPVCVAAFCRRWPQINAIYERLAPKSSESRDVTFSDLSHQSVQSGTSA
jgi:putative two-component system response regulator